MIKPLRDLVAILPDADESTTNTGIVLVQASNTKHVGAGSGTVVAVGPGLDTDDGVDTMDVQVGQKVMFNKGTGITFEVEKTKYLFIKQRDLMGVLT